MLVWKCNRHDSDSRSKFWSVSSEAIPPHLSQKNWRETCWRYRTCQLRPTRCHRNRVNLIRSIQHTLPAWIRAESAAFSLCRQGRTSLALFGRSVAFRLTGIWLRPVWWWFPQHLKSLCKSPALKFSLKVCSRLYHFHLFLSCISFFLQDCLHPRI